MVAGRNDLSRLADAGAARAAAWAVAFLMPQPWLAGLLTGDGAAWAGPAASLVAAAGIFALHRAAPGERRHIPMLLWCSTAMLAGLALDRIEAAPLDLASLCLAGDLSFWPSSVRHGALMPWMHAGMLVVTLAALGASIRQRRYRRAAVELACGLGMLASMDAVAWGAARLATGAAMPLAWSAMAWSVALLVRVERALPPFAGPACGVPLLTGLGELR
jgi:hypothetical protein